jgi:hypothetical protein
VLAAAAESGVLAAAAESGVLAAAAEAAAKSSLTLTRQRLRIIESLIETISEMNKSGGLSKGAKKFLTEQSNFLDGMKDLMEKHSVSLDDDSGDGVSLDDDSGDGGDESTLAVGRKKRRGGRRTERFIDAAGTIRKSSNSGSLDKEGRICAPGKSYEQDRNHNRDYELQPAERDAFGRSLAKINAGLEQYNQDNSTNYLRQEVELRRSLFGQLVQRVYMVVVALVDAGLAEWRPASAGGGFDLVDISLPEFAALLQFTKSPKKSASSNFLNVLLQTGDETELITYAPDSDKMPMGCNAKDKMGSLKFSFRHHKIVRDASGEDIASIVNRGADTSLYKLQKDGRKIRNVTSKSNGKKPFK